MTIETVALSYGDVIHLDVNDRLIDVTFDPMRQVEVNPPGDADRLRQHDDVVEAIAVECGANGLDRIGIADGSGHVLKAGGAQCVDGAPQTPLRCDDRW